MANAQEQLIQPDSITVYQFEEKSFDELANIMKLSPSGLNSLLTILEMQGIIRQSAGKLYRTII